MDEDLTTAEASDPPDEVGQADDAVADREPTDSVQPVVDPGECPLCGTEFDDAEAFRDHLGAAHDLYDDEGATSVLMRPTITTVEPTEAAVPIISLPAPRTPPPTPPPGRSRVRVGVLGVLLVVVVAGVLAFVLHSTRRADVAADDGWSTTQSVEVTGSRPAGPGAPSTPPALFAPSGAPGSDTTGATAELGGGSTTADSVTSSAGATPGGAPTAQPTSTTSSTVISNPPSTTAPLSTFVAPTTSGAGVDGCTRDHGQWIVTYSWQFVGGVGWRPLAAYTSLGGGRYQDTVALAPGGNSSISTVQVTDSTGTTHDVALQPALSTSGC